MTLHLARYWHEGDPAARRQRSKRYFGNVRALPCCRCGGALDLSRAAVNDPPRPRRQRLRRVHRPELWILQHVRGCWAGELPPAVGRGAGAAADERTHQGLVPALRPEGLPVRGA